MYAALLPNEFRTEKPSADEQYQMLLELGLVEAVEWNEQDDAEVLAATETPAGAVSRANLEIVRRF